MLREKIEFPKDRSERTTLIRVHGKWMIFLQAPFSSKILHSAFFTRRCLKVTKAAMIKDKDRISYHDSI